MISCSLSPNTDLDDVIVAFKTLFSPWAWKKGSAYQKVQQWFCHYLTVDEFFLFDSGRGALFAILESFGIGVSDEVLVQAFTCVAVPNSVLWCGAKPVFVDIDQTANIDPTDVEKKITKRTKAIIIQHTFGTPAQMEKLLQVAQKHKVIVIEDCAHSLGATYKGKKIGTFGDAAFFSFERDKVVSSVWGGGAYINSKFKIQNSKLSEYMNTLSYPSFFWIKQQLLHPVAFSFILPLYDVGIGKLILFFLQKVGLLSKPVLPMELKGGKPDKFPSHFPNALAMLLLHQLKKLDEYNAHRLATASFYQKTLEACSAITLPQSQEGSIFLRFAVTTKNPTSYLRQAKQRGILLGNWYHNIIDPKGVEFTAIGYKHGSCPRAEKMASTILNLPTRISQSQARQVAQFINETSY